MDRMVEIPDTRASRGRGTSNGVADGSNVVLGVRDSLTGTTLVFLARVILKRLWPRLDFRPFWSVSVPATRDRHVTRTRTTPARLMVAERPTILQLLEAVNPAFNSTDTSPLE